MSTDQLSMMKEEAQATTPAQRAVARSEQHYDQVPYESKPFPQTHPARLAAAAKLFGLTPPDVRTACVLELGAASGGNIIPLAAEFPDGKFLGIDLSGMQVAVGKARIRRLALHNIELRHLSITDVGEADGQFDYIICHGVYSWVPEHVRHAILRVCRERLSPHGIAYVSYNVLPGWRQKQALRDAMLLYTGGPGSADGARRAREMLAFLETNTQAGSHYGAMVRSEAGRLANLGDDYITHEYLEDENTPCTFTEFANAAAAQGLAYLAEAEVATMLPETVDAASAARVREISANQLIPTEQVIDLVTGRTFRQTMMVNAELAGSINRQLNQGRIEGLHFLAPRGLKLTSQDNGVCVFTDMFGRTLRTGNAAVRDAIERLIALIPSSAALADMTVVPSKKRPGTSDADRAGILDALFKMHICGMIGLASEPVHCGARVAKPVAMQIARTDAAAGLPHSVNARHESVTLDIVTQHVLPKLDGTHDEDALYAHVHRLAADDQIVFQRNGERIVDADGIAACAREHLTRALDFAANAGLLVQ